jgi:diadenosine tetraphosphate (Ap4A) HIT family hydrolase
MNASKNFVNPRFARKKEYKKIIQKIIIDGKCPFCRENFKYHKNPILKKTKSWFITKSSWPYENAEHHFLIISEKHKENFKDLTLKDFKEVKNIVNWTVKKFKLKGGGLTLRFGNSDHTGSTVNHLHFHLIVPKLKSGKSLSVNFPIG